MSRASTPVRGILRTAESKAEQRTSSTSLLVSSKHAFETSTPKWHRRESVGGTSALECLSSPRRVTFSPYVPNPRPKLSKVAKAPVLRESALEGDATDASEKEVVKQLRRLRMRYAIAKRKSLATRIRHRLVSLWTGDLPVKLPPETTIPTVSSTPTLPDLWAIDRAYIERQNRLMTARLHARHTPFRVPVESKKIKLKYQGAFDALVAPVNIHTIDAADVLLADELPGVRRRR
ncbi:hypothetical protein H310_13973 [Aphanomyces invadans]|uniref:Uncharacterized protein n=1 Tax=Aphanomyces invadans TaxID=157072 RepID=A0A024TCY4_9STRA|nr:hypothetical protein H310_13973 [Aphanomyces invadans]ETV91426.1 hypothetical protein H310_13973 [Aphanomyces invadans]|eukprot:XP_008879878.1 hypothetical protein H310_13973 [Aphanomyces invadans]